MSLASTRAASAGSRRRPIMRRSGSRWAVISRPTAPASPWRACSSSRSVSLASLLMRSPPGRKPPTCPRLFYHAGRLPTMPRRAGEEHRGNRRGASYNSPVGAEAQPQQAVETTAPYPVRPRDLHPMSSSAASTGTSSKYPHLPPMHRVGDLIAPKAPQTTAASGLDESSLTDLALKLAFTVARFTTDWAAQKLHLPLSLTSEILELLMREGLVDETMKTSATRSHYRITQRGLEHAGRLLEVCGYVGPTPVRLEAYASMLRWQF